MLKETINLDWFKDFGINIYDDSLYKDMPILTNEFNNGEHGYWKNHTKGIKRFTHKEYAFKFSSHELDFVDLKMVLERLEKVLVLEEWEWMLNRVDLKMVLKRHALSPVRFNGKLQVFSLKDIDKILTQNTLFSDQIDEDIKTQIQIKKERNNEYPVFIRRIPWELHLRSTPIWYSDTGYREVVDFETMKKRKPTTDEIVNNASLYTRFSTGFV